VPIRWGPGPVFIHESIVASRRWQPYALRSLLVIVILAALALVFQTTRSRVGPSTLVDPIRALAALGESFYYAIATAQLVFVLLVAPAATAGAICVDRARGTLAHMLMTDLTDSEIVLGKLGAHLVPVLALVAATVPVLALAGLLGGIIIEAIVTLTLITIVLAVLGCALALALSVRATKMHEVLMAVYGIFAVWIIGPLIWEVLFQATSLTIEVPEWYLNINPIVLAWAPYAWPDQIGVEYYAAVLAGATLVSAGLVLYAILRLRAATTKETKASATKTSSWLSRAHAWMAAARPGPSLDDDPVLWREWRRGRPSRIARVFWGVYIVLAMLSSAWSVVVGGMAEDPDLIALVGGFQVMFGLLLVSLTAPTALAEERARGSLDVLMTTPLSTDRIVLAKWWGAYRVVPALAFLPALLAVAVGYLVPATAPQFGTSAQPADPVGWIDRVAFMCLPTALMLAQGAVVTSFGLALATWIRRVGRAVAVSAATYAAIAFGWLLLIVLDEVTVDLFAWLGLANAADHESLIIFRLIGLITCPLGALLGPLESLTWSLALRRDVFYIEVVIAILITLGIALLILGLTLVTFNRSMGRMPERRRRIPLRPRQSRTPREPHIRKNGSRRRAQLQQRT
jgi:ABC-type transport system involved in multi-copper enzyme maturation permease subunit